MNVDESGEGIVHGTSLEAAHSRAARQFSDPRREWRRLFSEGWGTFLLVLAAAGAGAVGALTGKVSASTAAVVPGLTVMSIIYFMGTVSGAHLNPAVTIAFAVRRNFPWRRVPGYLAAQFAGGILAAGFLAAVLGRAGTLGATVPGNGITSLQSLSMEIVLTAGLVNTILGTATGARNIGTNGAIAIGGYIALAGLWAGPISGASMNPARSFAPDLVRGDFATTWIYFAGPVAGAIIAAGFEWILRGPATTEGTRTAQGSWDEESHAQ